MHHSITLVGSACALALALNCVAIAGCCYLRKRAQRRLRAQQAPEATVPMGVPLADSVSVQAKAADADLSSAACSRGCAASIARPVGHGVALCDMVAYLRASGVVGEVRAPMNYMEIVNSACVNLGIDAAGRTLIERAQMCVEMVGYRIAE